MNAICFKIPRLAEETIRIEQWDLPYFYDELHFHEECQITCILQGNGVLQVGNQIDDFSEGDLLIIGKNTPHVLRTSKEFNQQNNGHHVRAISIFFSKDTFQEILNVIPETSRIEEVLEQTKFGIRIRNQQARKVLPYIRSMTKMKQLGRIALFIKILDMISTNLELEIIASSMPSIQGKEDSVKLNRVYNYIIKHYDQRITLREIADLVNLSPTAFCRFFKMRTQKTFSRFLIEVRINQACKMLSNGNYNVTETLFSCGYNNSSNFHRHFRQHTGLTPLEYREKALMHTAYS